MDNHQILQSQRLDHFLSQGWYRMGQTLFTNDYIYIEGKWVRVFWLRFRLSDFSWGSKQNALLKKFPLPISLCPFSWTDTHEELFQEYRASVLFDAPNSARRYLMDDGAGNESPTNFFPSLQFEIMDGSTLKGCGVFDRGYKSIAGILNIFHPDLKPFSPGKVLMLKKLEWALHQNFSFYYPGYIAWKYSKFDYKLFPGQKWAELWDPVEKVWFPYSHAAMEEMAKAQASLFEHALPQITDPEP